MPFTPLLLALGAVGFLIRGVVSQRIAQMPSGREGDPLPAPSGALPPAAHHVHARRTVVAPKVVAAAIQMRAPRLPSKGVEILLAQHLLATRRGVGALNHNPAMRGAGPTWGGMWTMFPVEQIIGGRPVFQWTAIRAYRSTAAGVADWLTDLPPSAKRALMAGSYADFARALAEAGRVDLPADEYAHLLYAARMG